MSEDKFYGDSHFYVVDGEKDIPWLIRMVKEEIGDHTRPVVLRVIRDENLSGEEDFILEELREKHQGTKNST